MFRLFTVVVLTAAAAFGQMRWVPVPGAGMEVDGLPWFKENGGEFWRLPVRSQEKFPKAVWNLAKSPSGARIRFRTDARTLAVRLEYPGAPNMANMHAFGQTGVDLYMDGAYWSSATADKEAKPGKVYEHTYYNLKSEKRVEREVTIYLSLYMPVKALAIGVDEQAKIAPARPFAVAKPVVFYGTSITQGGCASRPGMSYQAIVGRMLNIDFVNLGFSGNGKGEPDVARAVAEIDASCFVLDFAQNNKTVESLAEAYKPFIETLRAAHPDTPIIAITPIYSSREATSEDVRLDQMRALIRRVAGEKIAAGDTHLQLVEGTDLLGPAPGDTLVDGTHPNDLGFQRMAEGLAPRLLKMLGIAAR